MLGFKVWYSCLRFKFGILFWVHDWDSGLEYRFVIQVRHLGLGFRFGIQVWDSGLRFRFGIKVILSEVGFRFKVKVR